MLKIKIYLLLLTVIFMTVLMSCAVNEFNFEIENQTGETLVRLERSRINDNAVFDRETLSLANGKTHHKSAFFRAGWQPAPFNVTVTDASGDKYVKLSVNILVENKITFTPEDKIPILTITNRTGYDILYTGTDHVSRKIAQGYSVREFVFNGTYLITYSIEAFTFNKEVVVDGNTIVELTDRPPLLDVVNRAGMTVSLSSELFNTTREEWYREAYTIYRGDLRRNVTEYRDAVRTVPVRNIVTVENGQSSGKIMKKNPNALGVSIVYAFGTFQASKNLTWRHNDITLTLTEQDRPPIVTVENRTGFTVNNVFIRNTGQPSWGLNLLTQESRRVVDNQGNVTENRLVGQTAATEITSLIGSFTNNEDWTVWLHDCKDIVWNIDGLTKYDIRIDDVQGSAYVKRNVDFPNDMSLTFTQEDKQ